ncbi:MAG: hypothetical protein B6U73_01620 [Desulfurococcales archaeon ex4484_204]|nr:MAG: hypothetical protein B6U73_01620 [Desulfurococcales archaeon ex4484_204]
MEDPVIFKGVEELTLKRDNLLRRLRRQVSEYGRGRVDVNTLEETLLRLRKARRELVKLLKEALNKVIGREYVELIVTLVEFSYLVSINDERELLLRVKALTLRKGLEGGVVDKVNEDLNEVREFSEIASKLLSRYASS